MRPIAADILRSVVCVMGTRVRCTETTEPRLYRFGEDSCGSKEPYIRVAGQISAFPIDFAGRPYNTLTLPCERVMEVQTLPREGELLRGENADFFSKLL